jgi:hypothetical protein
MIERRAFGAAVYLSSPRSRIRIGRKPVMLFGMVLMLRSTFPAIKCITRVGNPALARASTVSVTCHRRPRRLQFPARSDGRRAQFATSCDIAKGRAGERWRELHHRIRAERSTYAGARWRHQR